jgi:hypothetical protein
MNSKTEGLLAGRIWEIKTAEFSFQKHDGCSLETKGFMKLSPERESVLEKFCC